MILENKKVLFIAPNFHTYHHEIIRSLQKKGAKVVYFEEVFYSRIYTLVRDKMFAPFNKFLDKIYFNRILNSIRKDNYDIFFLIRGGLLDIKFLKEIKLSSPNVYTVMYQWDSVIHNDYRNKIDFFDKVYTFDKSDAEKLNIQYLPLFYTNGYAKIREEQENLLWDICFFGTYHSDRLKIIKKIDIFCQKNNLHFHHHLYAGKINQILLFLRGKIQFKDLKYFKTNLVSLNDIIAQYKITKSVLDIEMTNQTGLTIRTIEALGSGRKLLTTNKSIQDSEVFDKDYVGILNRENPSIDISFLNKKIINHQRYDNFHISKWLDQIMDI